MRGSQRGYLGRNGLVVTATDQPVLLNFETSVASAYDIDFTNVTVKELIGYSEIENYTAQTRTLYQNTNDIGFNNLLAEQDASGRAIAIREDYTANLKNPQGKSVGIGLKLNFTNYSVKEVVSGLLEDLNASGVGLGTFSQREEFRVLTKEGATYKLYINGVLQPYTPSIPDPNTYININEIAIIGHADTRDFIKRDFGVWTSTKDSAFQLAEYNQWVIDNP